MSGKKEKKGLFRVALESGFFPASWTRRIGGYALTKATELTVGRPPETGPELVERIRSEVPANEARIGQNFLEIADMTDPASADSALQERELRAKQRGYRVYGYSKIVKALLQADADPSVPPDIERQVVEIAKESGTDPTRLDAMFSERERRRAQHIIEP